jgi:hypothetical protein
MIYQVRTFNDLHKTKVYCTTHKEIKNHIGLVVKKTEENRKWMSNENLEASDLARSPTKQELMASLEILKIDPFLCTEWETIFVVPTDPKDG